MAHSFFIRLLFDKQPARFNSSFGIEESVERLSWFVKRWPYLPPYRKSLIGTVKSNKVSLSLGKGGWEPVFHGKFRIENGVTILDGCFVRSLYIRILLSLWFGLLILSAFEIPIRVLTNTNTALPLQYQLFSIFSPWLMFFFGVALVSWSKWRSRNNIKIISQQVHSALQPTEGELTLPN